ncbi:hypothetical protein EYF80_028014 [Liparis tanakae]|uniref:Uncharacterized protein n=1 Tax=Liparis tanakae TaxID=230148 RepID=A0A4Z2HAH8_9TELE|nr:hypothetical protein EYF80_028014 [Liparis tanakae]
MEGRREKKTQIDIYMSNTAEVEEDREEEEEPVMMSMEWIRSLTTSAPACTASLRGPFKALGGVAVIPSSVSAVTGCSRPEETTQTKTDGQTERKRREGGKEAGETQC